MSDLNRIWYEVASVSKPRRKLMYDLDEELESIEVERSKQVSCFHTVSLLSYNYSNCNLLIRCNLISLLFIVDQNFAILWKANG